MCDVTDLVLKTATYVVMAVTTLVIMFVSS